MNAIELLKEARDASVRVLDGLNARIDRASKQGEPIPVYNGIVELHDLMGKIDAYLAALAEPEPDAKWESIISKIRATDSKGEYRLDYWLAQKLIEEFAEQHAEAAALIADFGRRVPRAMLREVYNLSSIEWERSADAIAAKYGVKVEGR